MFKPNGYYNKPKNGMCFDEFTLNEEGYFRDGLSLHGVLGSLNRSLLKTVFV